MICILMVAGFSGLSVRLIYLHVVMHEEYLDIAKQAQQRRVPLYSSRGSIFDRHGELLASSQRVYKVVADRHHLANYDIARRGVAKAEGISMREVARKYDREEIKDRYLARLVRVIARPLGYHGWELRQLIDETDRVDVVLQKHVEEDKYRELRDLLTTERLGGVYFRPGSRRYYPSPRTLTHVLGFVNHEGEAQEGIEKQMDAMLAGEDGYREITRGPSGKEIVAHRGETVEPLSGHDVRLTIDMGMQNIVEAALDEAWYEYRPEKICAVFLDPKTSAVRAMASRPHFDLETREGNRRNLAVADTYEPGSTFKIVTFSGALDKGLVSRRTPINCHNGKYQDGALVLGDGYPYGDLTTEGVLAKSSNIGSYKVAAQLGKKAFFEYMMAFGFGTPTGIELTGEAKGIVHPLDTWNLTSFSRNSIGYAVSVTPLQMVNALAAVANGGQLMRPYLVESVVDSKGRLISEKKPEAVRRIMSERAAGELRKMLRTVVDGEGIEGVVTGANAAVEGYSVGGKTGTARKVNPDGRGYLAGRYVVSFMGFLPADDPKILGIIVVDDPQTHSSVARYGGTVAAPIFSRIAKEAAAYFDLEPDFSGALAKRGDR
ncbi:MAG: penicillin-binding protein 2 [Verrucomicrobiota bacterium]